MLPVVHPVADHATTVTKDLSSLMAILENKSVTAVLDMLCMSGRSSAINTIELTHVLDICSSHIAHT